MKKIADITKSLFTMPTRMQQVHLSHLRITFKRILIAWLQIITPNYWPDLHRRLSYIG